MTVNVYTYYANKLAFEEAQRQRGDLTRPVARKRVRRMTVPVLVQLGLALGFASSAILTMLFCPSEPPYLLVIGIAWGAAIGWVAEHIRRRIHKFLSVLKGAPLDREDLRALTGRS